MNKRAIISTAIALLLMLSASCNAFPSSPATATFISPTVTPKTSINWWTAWLAQPVCKPPCWENITPGVTTIDEAKSILEKMPGVAIDYESPWGLSWDFGAKDQGGNIVGSDDRKVDCIWMGNSGDPAMHLEQIVAVYHFPEYVKPYDCDPAWMCSIALIYPDLGLLFSTYTEMKELDYSSPEFSILPEDEIYRVYFFEPGIEFLDGFYNQGESELPIRWKGYGDYP